MERWLVSLVTQRQLKLAVEGYQVCTGEKREDEHPHFSGHDLTLSQILRGARNELSLLNDAQWLLESLTFNHPASAPYTQRLAVTCQQLTQRLQRPVHLLEVGTRAGRATESLLAQLSAGQIEYTGLEQSQETLLSARRRLVPWPGARLPLRSADALATHARSADIIWFNNALHRLLSEDPGLLATLQQLTIPDALLCVMEFCQLAPSALLSTLLLTSEQPEALLHNSADQAASFNAAAFNCQYGDEVAGLQRFLIQCPDGQVRHDPRQLQATLTGRLPRWMVLQWAVFLDALPLTTNGEIDYQVLKRHHTPEAKSPAETDLPQGDIEKQIAALWQQLLSAGNVTRETDFPQQGDDSLPATRLTG